MSSSINGSFGTPQSLTPHTSSLNFKVPPTLKNIAAAFLWAESRDENTSSSLYDCVKEPIFMTRAYLGTELDLKNSHHEHLLQLSIKMFEHGIDRLEQGLPTELYNNRLTAIKLLSAYQDLVNRVGPAVNPVISTFQYVADVGTLLTGIPMCLANPILEKQRHRDQYISLQQLKNTFSPEDLTRKDIREALESLNLSPEGHVYLMQIAAKNLRNEEGNTRQTSSNFFVEADVLSELVFVLQKLDELQGSSNASNQEVIYLSGEVKKLVEQLGPIAETINLLAETSHSNESSSLSTEKPSETVIKTAEAIRLLVGMINTYNTYHQRSQNDQLKIDEQRRSLQEAIYAESEKLKLGNINLTHFVHMSLPNIESHLLGTVTVENASNYLINRDKNFAEFETHLASLRSDIERGYQVGKEYDEKIEATAKTSEVMSKYYDGKIKRQQRRLRHAGRKLTTVQMMNSGCRLFSLYDPACGIIASTGFEIASMAIQRSYDRKMNHINKQLGSYNRVNGSYRQAGEIYERGAYANQTRLNNNRQDELNLIHEALSRPELYNPDDYCAILKEEIKNEQDCQIELKNEQEKNEIKLNEARDRKRTWEARKNGELNHFKKDMLKIFEIDGKITCEDAIITDLKVCEEDIKKDIEKAAKREQKAQERLKKAEELAPLRKHYDATIKRYMISNDKELEHRQGYGEVTKAVQHQAAIYGASLSQLNQLIYYSERAIRKFDSNNRFTRYFDPSHPLRLPQTTYCAIQAHDVYVQANLAYNGLVSFKKLINDLQAKNVIDVIKKVSLESILVMVTTPNMGLILALIKAGIAGRAWWKKELIEDPLFSFIRDLHQESKDLLVQFVKESQQNNLEIKENIKEVLEDLDHMGTKLNNVAAAIKKGFLSQGYKNSIDNVLAKRQLLSEKNWLEQMTPGNIISFMEEFEHYGEDNYNPRNVPSDYLRYAPACYTNRLNQSLGIIGKIPNLWLFISGAHYFVQSLIKTPYKKLKNAQIFQSLKDSTTKLLGMANEENKLLSSFGKFLELADNTHTKYTKAVLGQLFQVNRERCHRVNNIARQQANAYLERKKQNPTNYVYLARLCYRLTRVAFPCLKKEECVAKLADRIHPNPLAAIPYCAIGGVGSAMMAKAASVIVELSLMPFIGPVASVASTAAFAATAIKGADAVGDIRQGIDSYLKISTVIEKINRFEGKTTQEIIEDKQIEVFQNAMFTNQYQLALSNQWEESIHPLYFPSDLLGVTISSGWIYPQVCYSSAVIDIDEIKLLPKASEIEKDYDVKVKQLFDAYDAFLQDEINDKKNPNNLFTKQLGEYRLIPSLKEGWLSLALPKEHIDHLEICIYMVELLGLGKCEPYYDFVYDEKNEEYQFCIHLKYKPNGNKPERLIRKFFTSRVDKTTVDCYKKIITAPTFAIEKTPNLCEVLVLLAYTSFIEGLGLPSEDSVLLKSNLVATRMQPFPGLYKIWTKHPGVMINFNSKVHVANADHIAGYIVGAPTEYTHRLETAVEERQQSFLEDLGGKECREYYRLAKAFCCLISDKSEKEVESMFFNGLHWFNPDQKDFLSQLLFLETLDESKPLDFLNFLEELQKTPGKYVTNLKRVSMELRQINEALTTEDFELLKEIENTQTPYFKVEDLESIVQ